MNVFEEAAQTRREQLEEKSREKCKEACCGEVGKEQCPEDMQAKCQKYLGKRLCQGKKKKGRKRSKSRSKSKGKKVADVIYHAILCCCAQCGMLLLHMRSGLRLTRPTHSTRAKKVKAGVKAKAEARVKGKAKAKGSLGPAARGPKRKLKARARAKARVRASRKDGRKHPR